MNDICQVIFSKRIWLYIFALLIILNANSLYIKDYSAGKIPDYTILVSSYICMAILVINQRMLSKKIVMKALKLCVCIGIFFLILYAVNPYNINVNIQWLLRMAVLILYFVICKDNENSLLIAYKNIMIFIACESIFFWLFGSVLGVIEHTGYLYSTWAANENSIKVCNSYYGIYFETQITDSFGNTGFIRNTAIFTEGPMASLNFCIALMVEYLLQQRPYMPFVVILVLAILSTVSTTGYLVLLSLVLFKLIMYPVNTPILKFVKFVGLPIATVVIAGVGIYVLADKQDTMSLLLRVDDFIVGYNTWIEQPIFGWGAGNTYPLQQHMDFWRCEQTGFSNSIFWVLVQGGIYLATPYIISSIYILFYLNKMKKYKALWFMIVYLIMLSFTIAPYLNITFVVFISFIMYANKKGRKYNFQILNCG